MIQFFKQKLTHKPKTSGQSWAQYYEHNEALFGTLIFFGGFIFDIFTLSDYDDGLALAQQSAYLIAVGSFIYFETLESQKAWAVPKWLEKVWVIREIAMHFLLGSLLSLYSLFFFKSASLATALVFMLVMATLLVANEFPQLQKRGPLVRWMLWSLCLLSFLQVLMPIIFTYVGFIPFTLAWILTAAIVGGIYWLLTKGQTENVKEIRGLLWPSGAALVVFFALYLFKAVPPVPIVLQDIGIYHKVEKSGGNYILTEERPRWKFWQRGDQDFQAKPNDVIYAYFAISSPGRIQDQIRLRWMFKDPKLGWTSADAQNIAIRGGRGGGYRGFAFKRNYQEGQWRVQVETTDEREIGRLSFEVTKVAAPAVPVETNTTIRTETSAVGPAPAVPLEPSVDTPAPPALPPAPAESHDPDETPATYVPNPEDDLPPPPPAESLDQ
jgi:hypothetical protein